MKATAAGPEPPAVLDDADQPSRRRLPPLWWRLGLTLACVYLPYVWLLGDYPWHDYRLTWIKMWPVLPGLVTFFVVGPHGTNTLHFSAMGAMTVVALGLFLLLAARSRRWVPISTALALALSLANSWIAYAIYRA